MGVRVRSSWGKGWGWIPAGPWRNTVVVSCPNGRISVSTRQRSRNHRQPATHEKSRPATHEKSRLASSFGETAAGQVRLFNHFAKAKRLLPYRFLSFHFPKTKRNSTRNRQPRTRRYIARRHYPYFRANSASWVPDRPNDRAIMPNTSSNERYNM